MKKVYLQSETGQIVRVKRDTSILFAVYKEHKNTIEQAYETAKGSREGIFRYTLNPQEKARLRFENILKGIDPDMEFYLCLGDTYTSLIRFTPLVIKKGVKDGN